jgi:hypothetical protein
MKTKIILFSIILVGITSRIGFCQTDDDYSVKNIDSESLLSGELFNPEMMPNISTHFNKEWLLTDILLTDYRLVRNKMIKYNGLLDELFWLEPESNQTIKLDKEAIMKFHFLNFQGDTTIRFRKIKVKRDIFKDSSEIFVQDINNGTLSLLISHSFYFAGKEPVRMNQLYYMKEIYNEEPVYYLEFPDNKLIEFRKFSRKNLYKSIPDKKEMIRRYFRESASGKIQTVQEILDFVQFLSSISE